MPFGAGTEAEAFVVKVSQGNVARSGDAFLFIDNRDDPRTDLGTQIATCEINGVPGDSTTTCMTMNTSLTLAQKDSLSCFISTDGGSFEGASCAVVVNTVALP